MAAKTLTFAEFLGEVAEHRTDTLSKAQIKHAVEAIAEELGDCMANGYKVSIPGVAIFTPRAKAGRKKGTVVRNPFDGSEKTLKKDEPDSVVVKVKAAGRLKDALPSPTSKAGAELVKALLKAKK